MPEVPVRSPILLRAASILAAVQCVAHAALLLTYAPMHGPAETAVVAAMRGARFDFGGFAPHSYWEMYIGYGLFAAFNCAVEAVLFWRMARAMDRRVVSIFLFANLGYAALVAMYFFTVPLVFDLAVALCLGLSLRDRPVET